MMELRNVRLAPGESEKLLKKKAAAAAEAAAAEEI